MNIELNTDYYTIVASRTTWFEDFFDFANKKKRKKEKGKRKKENHLIALPPGKKTYYLPKKGGSGLDWSLWPETESKNKAS